MLLPNASQQQAAHKADTSASHLHAPQAATQYGQYGILFCARSPDTIPALTFSVKLHRPSFSSSVEWLLSQIAFSQAGEPWHGGKAPSKLQLGRHSGTWPASCEQLLQDRQGSQSRNLQTAACGLRGPPILALKQQGVYKPGRCPHNACYVRETSWTSENSGFMLSSDCCSSCSSAAVVVEHCMSPSRQSGQPLQ